MATARRATKHKFVAATEKRLMILSGIVAAMTLLSVVQTPNSSGGSVVHRGVVLRGIKLLLHSHLIGGLGSVM